MTGRVVCFRPRLHRGIVKLESGDELAFEADGDVDTISGDDVIEFAVQENGKDKVAKVIRVVEKGFAQPSDYQHMLRELFGTLDIKGTTTK